jgi:hypothetical protein
MRSAPADQDCGGALLALAMSLAGHVSHMGRIVTLAAQSRKGERDHQLQF